MQQWFHFIYNFIEIIKTKDDDSGPDVQPDDVQPNVVQPDFVLPDLEDEE